MNWQTRLLVLVVACLPAAHPSAQSPPRPNVVSGALSQFDAANGLVTIRSARGGETSFRVEDKTLVLRLKRKASPGDFKPADVIFARYRKSAPAPAPLYDLADGPSWKWLERVRKETTLVKITSFEDDWLRAAEGADETPISFRFTQKTVWTKSGMPAGPEVFQTGESVYIAPRLLPNGAIMATAVADTEAMANVLRERARPTVTGIITGIALAERTMRLKTRAGDDRTIRFAERLLVTREGKPVGEASLRTGQTVTAHVRKQGESEERLAVRVTIQVVRHPGANRSAVPNTGPRPKPTRSAG